MTEFKRPRFPLQRSHIKELLTPEEATIELLRSAEPANEQMIAKGMHRIAQGALKCLKYFGDTDQTACEFFEECLYSHDKRELKNSTHECRIL